MPKDLYYSSLIDVYGYCLNEKQRSVLECYYNDDLSLSEIAENEGITRQGVADLIKRSEKQLKELESRCCYCEKFLRLKTLAGKLDTDNDVLREIASIIDSL